MLFYFFFFFFFFNDTATTEIYTLSLHDALPICLIPLGVGHLVLVAARQNEQAVLLPLERLPPAAVPGPDRGDRKSTRLNSSHVKISYAVFCLKKKKTQLSE